LAWNWFPGHAVNLGNGLITCAALVGIAATAPVFGMLIDRLDWPGAFLASSVFTLGVAAAWTVIGADAPREAKDAKVAATALTAADEARHPDGGTFRALLKDERLICLTLSYAAVGYFQYLFFYWAQFYFEKVLQEPKDASRFKTSLLNLAMGAGMAAGGWLSDRAVTRFGRRWGMALVPAGGLLLGAIMTCLGAVAVDATAIVVCFAVAMAGVGSSEGAFWTASVRIGGPLGATAASILNTGGNAGGLLAPVLTPFISKYFGWQAGLFVASGVSLTGAILWLGVRERSIHEPDQVAGSA
jgi:sugar phosphate permease